MLSSIRKYFRAALYDPVNDRQLQIESNGGVPVNIQDQTSRAFDIRLCQTVTGPYTLASNVSAGSYQIVLNSATGLTANDTIGLFQDSTDPRSYFGNILSISTNTLNMDTPVDGNFLTSLSPVLFEILCKANVSGSIASPQIFKIDNDSNQAIDITRVMLYIEDDSAMDDGRFGGIVGGLTNGIVLRKKNADGTFVNYWHKAVKTNGGLALNAYDVSYTPNAPAGNYGLRMRYSFAGQDKHGVAVRLENTEELQLIVQDNLTGLVDFQIMAQGHFVMD